MMGFIEPEQAPVPISMEQEQAVEQAPSPMMMEQEQAVAADGEAAPREEEVIPEGTAVPPSRSTSRWATGDFEQAAVLSSCLTEISGTVVQRWRAIRSSTPRSSPRSSREFS